MKKILLFASSLLLLAACSQEDGIGEETVEVSFSAGMPRRIETRTDGTTTSSDLVANKVVCAVFDKDGAKEYPHLRKIVDIVDGTAEYSPRLVRDHTYQVVFWAMKDDAYNVEAMTNIHRNEHSTNAYTEEDYDAFTGHTEITVTGSGATTVTLKRPLAKINTAIPAGDFELIKKFGMTPTTMEIKFSVFSAYNALLGQGVSETEQTYSLPIANTEFPAVNGEEYRLFSMNYALASGETQELTYTIKGKAVNENGEIVENTVEEVICDHTINNVPIKTNYITNITGDLMFNTYTYTIQLQQAFESTEENAPVN